VRTLPEVGWYMGRRRAAVVSICCHTPALELGQLGDYAVDTSSIFHNLIIFASFGWHFLSHRTDITIIVVAVVVITNRSPVCLTNVNPGCAA
jgi:hypothetical protein